MGLLNCMHGYWGQGISHGMPGFGHGLFWMCGTIAVVVVIALIAFFHMKKKGGAPSGEAEELLKMRYINGEITEEEYRKMKKMIK